ncbi:MAG: hypothetical protein L0Y56_22475 [Nitrospira sp.]|nr:hypothetical protein [Nitrospira sp.]
MESQESQFGAFSVNEGVGQTPIDNLPIISAVYKFSPQPLTVSYNGIDPQSVAVGLGVYAFAADGLNRECAMLLIVEVEKEAQAVLGSVCET